MRAFDRLTERQPLLDGPVQQHYVSKFYLKGFARNRRVAVYDRTTGAVNLLTPRNAAAIEHFYTFIDESDRQRFELEALFGIVESRAGTALKSAICRAAVIERMQHRLDSKPDAMTLRRSTIEHVFGTLKHWMGSTHFLMKTMAHVGTEMSLHVLAYNLKRVMSVLGIAEMMKAMRLAGA